MPETVVTTNDLGELVRHLREAKGWSRATLSAHSGVSGTTIAAVELYGRIPRVDTLDALAEALGTTTSALLGVRDAA